MEFGRGSGRAFGEICNSTRCQLESLSSSKQAILISANVGVPSNYARYELVYCDHRVCHTTCDQKNIEMAEPMSPCEHD